MSETDTLSDLLKAAEASYQKTEARLGFVTPPLGTYTTALVGWIAKPFESRGRSKDKLGKGETFVRFTMRLKLYCEHLPEYHHREMATSFTTEPAFKDKAGDIQFIDLARLKGVYALLTDGGEANTLEELNSFFTQAAELETGLTVAVSERTYPAKNKDGTMEDRTATNIDIVATCELPTEEAEEEEAPKK